MISYVGMLGGNNVSVELTAPTILSLDVARGTGDYYLLMTYGQSLSINTDSAPLIENQRVGISMFDSGVVADIPSDAYLVPYRKSNDTLISAVKTLDKYNYGKSKFILITPGIGGAPMVDLQKPSTGYDRIINAVTQAKRVADLEGVNVKVLPYFWIHGEQDTLNNQCGIGGDYKGAMKKLASDLNTDIKAITGQSEDVLMFTDSLASSSRYGRYPNLAMDMVIASKEDSLIYFTAPLYMSDNASETNVHGSAQLYQHIGVNYGAKLLDVKQGLIAVSHSYSNLKSTITFNVPVPPLVLDTTQVNNLPDGNYGFKLFDRYLDPTDCAADGSGNSTISEPTSTITSVTIVGNTVEITYDSDPTGSYLTYGVYGTGWQEVSGLLDNPNFKLGRVNGARGCLRDSQGSNIQIPIYDANGVLQHEDISNWCGIFEYLIQ